MPTEPSADPLVSYDYAVIRVVPRVERMEFLNVGVILFCRRLRFLDARIDLDPERLRAFSRAPIDPGPIERSLAVIGAICRGEGPIGLLPRPDRFHWLVAPRSTIVQTSPVHVGVCTDPHAQIDRLMNQIVGSG